MSPHATDLRDMWRPGSGLTLRRIWLLFHALPPESATWTAIAAKAEQAERATPDRLRERQEHYQQRARGA
jgi:hypothetical protein